jgi:hypothetical protein
MIRALCLIGGLTGAAGLSQGPEFSQQYLQRLAGQVDELTRLAEDFDRTALAEGLGREEMLQAMAMTPLVTGQSTMWRTTFARHARLSENLDVLRAATPLERLTVPHRMADPETIRAVWADFTPAVPVSVAGAASAGVGFIGGWAAFLAIFSFVAMPFRKSPPRPSKPHKTPKAKTEPQLHRPTLVASNPPNRPRLAGVQR